MKSLARRGVLWGAAAGVLFGLVAGLIKIVITQIQGEMFNVVDQGFSGWKFLHSPAIAAASAVPSPR